ncbi:MAG: transglycosylase SLT domain-containing protein, partial [Patescibacteria group bacterium]
ALDRETAKRDFFDLKSGVSPRQTPFKELSDNEVDTILCQLAASADPGNPYFEENPEERLFDEVLGYLSPNTENEFVYNLPINNPNQGPGIVDRTKTSIGNSPVPVRISTLFCTNKNLSSFLTKCSDKGFGNIDPIVCSSTPHWLKNPDLEGAFFSVFYPRLRQRAQMLTQNASAKGFLERCQEQEPEECNSGSGSLFSAKTIVSSDFGSLDPDIRTRILDQEKGNYNKIKGGFCYACKSTVIFFPNLTKANQTIGYVGKMTTPHKTHENLDDVPNTITYSNDDIKKTGVHNIDSKAPMGMANPNDERIDLDLKTLNPLEGFRSWFSRKVDIENCSISYEPDNQGVLRPTNVCQGQKTSLLETILYVSPQVYEFINSSQNFYNNLTPYAIQTKIETSIENATGGHSKSLASLTKAEMVSGNHLGGLLTAVQQYLGRNIDVSGRQLVPDSADQIAYGKSLEVQKQIQGLMFTPYNWQNLTSQDSTQYDSHRPSDGSSPSADFNPGVLSFCDDIRQSAQTYNLDPSLIAALISIESGGNPDAHSNCGAIGLMQVMPNDPQKYGEEPCLSKFDPSIFASRPSSDQLFDPEFNIQYGTQLLSGMISYWGGLEAGLTHYGPTGYDGYANLVLGVQSQNPTACQ